MLRRSALAILVLLPLCISAGRIAVVRSDTGEVPFLSANDRSRWATINALVEDGTYQIDRQLAIRQGPHQRRVWQTIDLVRHRGTDGRMHYYSSKPPLFPTLVAGVYWVVHAVTGMTLTAYPMYIGRIVLALTNLPLLAVFLLSTIGLIERTGRTHWGRLLAGTATALGTMVLPFTVTLNNHLPAISATAVTLWVLADPRRSAHYRWLLLAGLSAGFAAANELPALSMACLWAALAFYRQPFKSLIAFLPGLLLIAAAFFATNWIAHRSLRPPYAHRGHGEQITVLSASPDTAAPDPRQLADALAGHVSPLPTPLSVHPRRDEPGWLAETADGQRRFAVLPQSTGGWAIHHWDDWYDYPGSYWTGPRRGVDRGEPSRWRYALHVLIGHHGLFSITPVWLLSVLGAGLWLGRGQRDQRLLVAAIVLATLVCLAFYLRRPLIDRNYGGVSATFRWMLWFAPLWLWLMIPAADAAAARRWTRGGALALLAISVFSAATALANPWQSPWIYRYWDYLGWIAS